MGRASCCNLWPGGCPRTGGFDIIDYPLDRRLGYDALVAHVRGRLAGDRFVVVGESFSGPVAIELAASHPQVAGLVLAASFARHPLPSWFAVFAGWTDPRLIPFVADRRHVDGSGGDC